MDTQEIKNECCRGLGGKHKRKVIIVTIAVVAAFAVLAIVGVATKVRSERSFAIAGCEGGQFAGNEKMMARCGFMPGEVDTFYPPQDAAKKGELKVTANDGEHVKQAVSDIVTKNSGSIFSTKTSYTKEGKKRGSIVIQIPADKFESVFAALKAMGARVVSESTEIIPQSNIYYPMAAEKTQVAEDQKSDSSEAGVSASSSDSAVAMPTIYPPFPQTKQDKGYIRIQFSDSGKSWGRSDRGGRGAGTQTIAISGNDFVVIFGHNLLKASLLILLIAILLWFIKKLKEIKVKKSTKKTTIPAVKKVAVKKAAIKRSRVIRKR